MSIKVESIKIGHMDNIVKKKKKLLCFGHPPQNFLKLKSD